MSLFPDTRWSLIAALPGQPRQAAALVGIYAEAVAAYLRARLAGERGERIDDVVQEVLLDLLRKPEVLAQARPGEGSRFRYYLMNLAWLGALNALRRHRRHERSAGEIGDADGEAAPPRVAALAASQPAPEQAAMDRAWALGVVHAAWEDLRTQVADGRLEADALRVLQRNLGDGIGLREIAGELGLSTATCQRRCARARAALQEAMAERLRLAGELGSDDDPAEACALLLAAIARG